MSGIEMWYLGEIYSIITHPSLWPSGISHTWDGTGCEFDSWHYRTFLIPHVHRAYDYLGPFGALWVATCNGLTWRKNSPIFIYLMFDLWKYFSTHVIRHHTCEDLFSFFLFPQTWRGDGTWIHNLPEGRKVQLLGRVNGMKFEIYNCFRWFPPQLVFTGTFGTGPTWTVPQVHNSEGLITRVMWKYWFEGTDTTLVGSFMDLFVPDHCWIDIVLHHVQPAWTETLNSDVWTVLPCYIWFYDTTELSPLARMLDG